MFGDNVVRILTQPDNLILHTFYKALISVIL